MIVANVLAWNLRMNLKKLPGFRNPPAVETMMGFYFAQLEGWNPLTLGLLFAEFRRDYPSPQFMPLVVDPSHVGATVLNLGPNGMIPVRVGFVNRDSSQLVQVQQSLFMRNWRRSSPEQDYMAYAALKPHFLKDWNRFLAFLSENQLKHPQVYRVEVIYVNHLVRGETWETYGDLEGLFRQVTLRARGDSNWLPEPAQVNINAGYNLKDVGVALQIGIQSAIRQPDGLEVIQFTINAKCDVTSNDQESLENALDRAHDSVILGFEDLTTATAHTMWGKYERTAAIDEC
jgi:uncharacterized protein (TIGR04255 family)